ncbi:MAG: NAD(P)/FAD-dependent oxidoreductase [Rhodospirillaceae bacterium]
MTSPRPPRGSDIATVDVAVVGAGVVGLAIAAALARRGREVVILEAAPAIGTGISSRNSEVIHAGIYYPAGSLKARLCVAGRDALYSWCDTHGVSTRRVGKMIVATDDAEAAALDALRLKAAANGVALEVLDGAQARALEPAVSCVAALLSPATGIVDSHALMLSYLGAAEEHGAALALNTPVLGGVAEDGGIRLLCGGAQPMDLLCRTVVNAAGLGAQRLTLSIDGADAAAVPALHLAKGSYFDLATSPPFQRLVYPMPVAAGLGVHYTVDMAGRGRFGPDVEWLPSPDARTFDPATLPYAVDAARGDVFYGAIRRYWPGLPDGALQPAYSGVRPKVQAPGDATAPDFILHGPAESGVDGLFTLYGIESPGLTSSLALAEHVAHRME